MNPFLWLLWAIAAIVILFIAAAVIHFVIEKYRELPPKRGWEDIGYIEEGGLDLETPANVHFRKAPHYDHVHWAMKPDDELIYDQGGVFGPPCPAVNMNGKPEPVLTAEQWETLNGL